jgi:hypothetical protein
MTGTFTRIFPASNVMWTLEEIDSEASTEIMMRVSRTIFRIS